MNRTLAYRWTLAPLLLSPSLSAAAQTIDEGTVVRSPRAMVVTDNPHASRAGARVLGEGGNAVDAAVAAAFTLSVVEPTMSGLGGRTQILLRMADGSVVAIDGTTEVPAAYAGGPAGDEDASRTATQRSPCPVLSPPSMTRSAHTARGRLRASSGPPWPTPRTASSCRPQRPHRFAAAANRLAGFPGSRRHFLRPDGSAYREGDIFRQPALAATLRTIDEQGADAVLGPRDRHENEQRTRQQQLRGCVPGRNIGFAVQVE
ncbi:MAG TPA: gamma-glutamyltransferase [Longimicrobiales bacterium]|nr:gamma-glutamyltransferase [Longimicrobiales bacterium]